MYPGAEKSALSYHADLNRWEMREGYTRLRSVGRGQEFVLDCEEYPEAVEWLAAVLHDWIWKNVSSAPHTVTSVSHQSDQLLRLAPEAATAL